MAARKSIFEAVGPSIDAESQSEIQCPDCAGHLAIHQPDERLPDRLLGTCRNCLVWFLIEGEEGLMLRLPVREDRRSASELRGEVGGRRSKSVSVLPFRFDASSVRPGDRRTQRQDAARLTEGKRS